VHALVPGQALAGGRYTVERSLSIGGMGAIYLAVDHEAFERAVVIKTLLASGAAAEPAEQQAAQERFCARRAPSPPCASRPSRASTPAFRTRDRPTSRWSISPAPT
jgi:hypothetical protein